MQVDDGLWTALNILRERVDLLEKIRATALDETNVHEDVHLAKLIHINAQLSEALYLLGLVELIWKKDRT